MGFVHPPPPLSPKKFAEAGGRDIRFEEWLEGRARFNLISIIILCVGGFGLVFSLGIWMLMI